MASHQRGKYLRPQLRHLQLRQPLPYSTSSPYCLPCPTAVQTPLPPQLARPTATTVTPSWAQRGHYSTSSPYYCPPAAVLALKLSTTEDTTSPAPGPLLPRPSPSLPALLLLQYPSPAPLLHHPTAVPALHQPHPCYCYSLNVPALKMPLHQHQHPPKPTHKILKFLYA